MIYVDTNVIMYAVGRSHELQPLVRARLRAQPPGTLLSSAEVLQELLHAYLPVRRESTLDAAMRLALERTQVRPVDVEDVVLARAMASTEPGLVARDLLHLAIALRADAAELWTYDRPLAAAFDRRRG